MALAAHEQRAKRRIGTVLRDKYALERVLGTGGMAAVYLGVHRNGHRVAVKVLHTEASADPDVRARFLREGYVANSIGHPGAVRVIDDDVAEDGAAFLVMELLEGETLYARTRRLGGRLPPREVLALARDVCDVLEAAHAKGVIHRDIKPENLFLTTERTLKVLDFGIARGGDAAPGAGGGGAGTRAGAALGTPAFMPPEQALGHSREVDARSDVWSVGATMFSLFSGCLVHEATTQGELLIRAATRPARSLAAAAPGAPAPIVALVDRALRFSRDERWPSARALADAIDEAYLAAFGEPISASTIGPVPAAPETRSSPASRPSPAPQVTLGDTQPAPRQPGPGPEAEARGPETQPDTLLPLSTQSSGRGQATTGAGSRASAPTVPAGASDPPPPPRDPAAGPLPGAAQRVASSPPPRPPERGGKALALLLAAIAGVALVVARTRHPGPVANMTAAGLAPCFTDADCASSGWVCSPGGRCVEPRGCSDDRACVASNAGRPSICRRSDGACVALESEDCHVLAEPGDVGNDATVWVGAMFPLSGPSAHSFGESSMRMVDLARRDFAEVAGGLPARATATGSGPKRPLAVVACDDTVDPARVAAHLADDVGVPAILGFSRSQEVADLAQGTLGARGVLELASNTASMLRAIPHAPGRPRLVWRTTTSADMQVPADAALIAGVIEPELRAAAGLLAPGEPIRVVLVREANTSGLSQADRCVASLRFNGKSVAENGPSFRQIVFADVSREDQLAAEAARVAAEIAAFRPHVVLRATESPLLPAVERAWPPGERFRPRYLLGGGRNVPEILALAQRRPDLMKRAFDVDTPASTAAVAKLVLRHNEVFPTKITASDVTGAPYDAFYVLAYAAAAIGGERITGPALARALPRLQPPGEPIDVGPAGIYQAFSLLGSGKGIDLDGTTTSLDFDPETGDATADFAVYCLTPGRDGALPQPVESGLVYRARSRKLEGTLRCP
jgi:serine/threonine protein kinase